MHTPRVTRPQRRPDPHPAVLRASMGGHSLPAPVQAKMERALGHDFGNVRVHRGEEAGSIGAAAFTRGSHIHFAPGRYNPHSAAGQRLLGHELAHVVQQRAGRVAMPGGAVPINADARLEAEADSAGSRAASGLAAGAAGAGAAIQRSLAPGSGVIQCGQGASRPAAPQDDSGERLRRAQAAHAREREAHAATAAQLHQSDQRELDEKQAAQRASYVSTGTAMVRGAAAATEAAARAGHENHSKTIRTPYSRVSGVGKTAEAAGRLSGRVAGAAGAAEFLNDAAQGNYAQAGLAALSTAGTVAAMRAPSPAHRVAGTVVAVAAEAVKKGVEAHQASQAVAAAQKRKDEHAS